MEENSKPKKYLQLSGRLSRTPYGFALTIYLNDRLLDAVKVRNEINEKKTET